MFADDIVRVLLELKNIIFGMSKDNLIFMTLQVQ
jgi:hypothetical protein